MGPHPDDLDHAPFFEYLVNQSMLDLDAAREHRPRRRNQMEMIHFLSFAGFVQCFILMIQARPRNERGLKRRNVSYQSGQREPRPKSLFGKFSKDYKAFLA
jgi:hypothetical protein